MNKIQHFLQTLSILLTSIFLLSINTGLHAQVCAPTLTTACSGSVLVVNGNFDTPAAETSGVGDCPGSIILSDGTNTVTLPIFNGCNPAVGSQETYRELNNVSLFDCTTTEFTVDIGNGVCNYTAPDGFDNNSAVLPVELSKFIAYSNESTVLIRWETLMEIENDFFTIEKSTDGRTFTELGKLDGAGNSIDIQQYIFIDREPTDGRNYYRLKQTDTNGLFEYFDVIVVEYRDAGNISIFPNPVQETMKISLTNNLVDQTAQVAIFSMSSGKQVSLTSIDATDYELNIDMLDLPAGMYTVMVNIGGQVFNKKIVKN